jgi:hypothetical protein
MADIIFPGEVPVDNVGTSNLPSNLDLTIWQGDKQEFIVKVETDTGVPIDLTGTTPSAVIRQSFTAPTSYPFACTVQGADNNEVRLYLSSAICETIPAGDYVWNFQIAGGDGDVRTYLAGDVKVYAQVD